MIGTHKNHWRVSTEAVSAAVVAFFAVLVAVAATAKAAVICAIYVAYAISRALQKINRGQLQAPGWGSTEHIGLIVACAIQLVAAMSGAHRDAAAAFLAIQVCAYLISRGVGKKFTETKSHVFYTR